MCRCASRPIVTAPERSFSVFLRVVEHREAGHDANLLLLLRGTERLTFTNGAKRTNRLAAPAGGGL